MFDYDGVIVDSFEIFTSTFMEACRAGGYDGFENTASLMDLLNGNFYEAMSQRGLSARQIDAIVAHAFQLEVQRHASEVKLFRGMRDLLLRLSQRHLLTVITSNFSSIVQCFLEKERLFCFADVLGGETEKSKVKKIEKTMARYPDLPAFYVGDTSGDMVEGKKAGAATVAVTWGWHGAEKIRCAAPDFTVHTPAELERLLM